MPTFLTNDYILFLIILWILPWKGVALWRAARRGEKWWFVALLVLNTLAVLEILYIFVFGKKTRKEKNKTLPSFKTAEMRGTDKNKNHNE